MLDFFLNLRYSRGRRQVKRMTFLEKLEALSQRVELLEKLLDEKFMEEKKAQENAECRMQNAE